MCVVSMTADHFRDRWQKLPYKITKPDDISFPWPKTIQTPRAPTQQEFDDLKKEVEILKELLKAAKEYDKKNNEPDCEIEEKMEFLRQAAKVVGIDLNDVIKKDEPARV